MALAAGQPQDGASPDICRLRADTVLRLALVIGMARVAMEVAQVIADGPVASRIAIPPPHPLAGASSGRDDIRKPPTVRRSPTATVVKATATPPRQVHAG